MMLVKKTVWRFAGNLGLGSEGIWCLRVLVVVSQHLISYDMHSKPYIYIH